MAIPEEADPFALFGRWFDEAGACKAIQDATAMALATVDEHGAPAVRMVLLKHWDGDGFVFYTNLGSPKARQLMGNPRAALCFYWMPLEKQIRIEGAVTPVSGAEADAYFASRDRQSRIGAWASKQSQPLTRRFELERRVAHFAARFGLGEIPRPSWWSGFRVRPDRIEFWILQPYRLHDRVCYDRCDAGWQRRRLFP